jgi:hypothetical protein
MLADHEMEIEAVNSRYMDARLASWTSRQIALARYATYDDAVRAAESELQSFLERQSNTEDDGPARSGSEGEGEIDSPGGPLGVSDDALPSWEKALRRLSTGGRDCTNRLVQKLKLVQASQTEYERGVIQENEAVIVSERSEVNALRRMQKMEEERMEFYSSAVVPAMFRESNSDCFVKTTPTTPQIVDLDASVAEGMEKKGKDLLATLFNKQSLPYEEGMGAMDAETLGLPEEIGLLRDSVKSILSAREKRIKAGEGVIRVVAEMADLASKTAAALKSTAKPPGSGTQRYFHVRICRTLRC